jgi:hypothetical protein
MEESQSYPTKGPTRQKGKREGDGAKNGARGDEEPTTGRRGAVEVEGENAEEGRRRRGEEEKMGWEERSRMARVAQAVGESGMEVWGGRKLREKENWPGTRVGVVLDRIGGGGSAWEA